MQPKYAVGQHVLRTQDNPPYKATILSVHEYPVPDVDTDYELDYEEGGTGWWPESSITLDPDYA